MLAINPKKHNGPWAMAYSLDKQVEKSTYIGDNASGYPQFENERTEIGEALFKLKYRSNKISIPNIIETSITFVKKYLSNLTFDIVIGVPPSDTSRIYQPVKLLAEGIAKKLNVAFTQNLIKKVKVTSQMKNMEAFKRKKLLKDAFEVIDESVVKSLNSLLIIDDLYDTGATLESIVNTLLEVNPNLKVIVLTITRTGKR